jgi:hypothetical protein
LIKERKGVAKFALRTGHPILPAYSIGMLRPSFRFTRFSLATLFPQPVSSVRSSLLFTIHPSILIAAHLCTSLPGSRPEQRSYSGVFPWRRKVCRCTLRLFNPCRSSDFKGHNLVSNTGNGFFFTVKQFFPCTRNSVLSP